MLKQDQRRLWRDAVAGVIHDRGRPWGHRYALYFCHLAGWNTLLTSFMWRFYQAVKKKKDNARVFLQTRHLPPRLPHSRYQSHTHRHGRPGELGSVIRNWHVANKSNTKNIRESKP